MLLQHEAKNASKWLAISWNCREWNSCIYSLPFGETWRSIRCFRFCWFVENCFACKNRLKSLLAPLRRGKRVKILLDKHSIIHGISIFFCWFPAQTRRDEKKIENFLLTTWRDKLNEEINWMISYISKESEPLCGAQSRSIRCYLGFELLPYHPSRNRNGRCNFISIFDYNKFIFNPPFSSNGAIQFAIEIPFNSFIISASEMEAPPQHRRKQQKLIIEMKKFEIRADEWVTLARALKQSWV